ncbi:exonuclease SbcC [Streptococcus oralis subsp. oralis]|uniref:Exonuclease SbcC n=1 Tax=Streptococcus oralis subsp. oralis TaxID=1891914 RepID=A0A1X1GZ48_STROR|nr:exonuclease SbcC [Streptococcus oralis]ORO51994.1 exonuclease SbcC [Streptococcus oralis subsp. oralis]
MTAGKKYIGAYSRDARDYFSLLPTEREIVEQLQAIYREEKGLFVLCGNRGSGKSSLKNISLEFVKNDRGAKDNKEILVVNVSFFSGNKDFHREILMQIPNAITRRMNDIEHDIGDFVNNYRRYYPTLEYNAEEKEKRYDWVEENQIRKNFSTIRRRLKKIEEVFEITSNIYNLCNELSNQTSNLFEQFNLLNKQNKLQNSKFPLFQKNRVDISIFRKNIDELYQKVEYFERKSVELIKLEEFLFISRQQLQYFDVEITNTKRYLESTTSDISAESSIDLSADIGIIKSGLQLRGKISSSNNEELSRELKSIVTEELKERQLLRLLKNMSEYFNITFSIDELDKCNTATIIDMIDKNKRLFFDCNVSTLLITDISTAISLLEKSDYISEPNIIVVPDLGILDYIHRINNKGLPLSYNFITILDSYFVNRMNNRELNYGRKYEGRTYYSKGFELYKFMNSTLYKGINELYRPMILKFYWELIDLLDFVGELSKEEYEQFENSFFNNNDLHSLKIKFILRKIIEQLTTQSFDYSFILKDGRSQSRQTEVLREFNKNESHIRNFLRQLALKPTLLSDETAFLKINHTDSETKVSYDFSIEFSDYLKKLGFDDETFRNVLLQLSKPRKKSIRYRRNCRFAEEFYDPYQGVEDARAIVKRENVVGVILFYPYDNSESADPDYKPLRNGIIVTVTDFDEIILYPYLGYIGLHSHKPSYLTEFKKELKKQDIPIYEIKDDKLWETCFEKDNKELEDKIFEVCKKEIESWLRTMKYRRS